MRLDESSEDSSYSNYQVNTRAKGDVVISAICPDGKFVKLQNKGTKVSIKLKLWGKLKGWDSKLTKW